MALAYLSLGSNLGDRNSYLEQACKALKESFSNVRFSHIYETEPVDLIDQPWFLNQVAEVQTDLSPESLLEWVQSFEVQMGRQRETPKGPRTLDLDILLYDDMVSRDERLILPHPRLTERRHVLVPLAELVPDKRLPIDLRSVSEVLEKVKDNTQVKLYAPS
jgi:2-amino-4-hydroxy-6-hydroxymethyldihydropteridine diphosphokinase